MSLTKKAVETAAEIKALHPLIEEIWGEVFTPIIGEEQVDYMLHTYQSEANIQQEIADGAKYFLLLDKETPVGYTAYELQADALYISKLYLKSDLRGKGYSSSVFAWFEEVAKAQGLSKLYLRVNKENTRAMQVYEHKGFEITQTKVSDIGHGFVMDDFIYTKKLA